MSEYAKYEKIAKEARIKVLELIHKAGTSHIGSNFSAIDLFAVLFDKADPSRDELILSSGWKAAAWYFFLWKKGMITLDELNSFCQPGSQFIGLVEPQNRWGLRIAGGSMGLGIGGAVGFAMSKKFKRDDGKVYCFMSDGEQSIGTTWESAAIAAHHKLNNLVVIIDQNHLQAMGETKEILNMEPLGQKWRSFGWNVRECNGHDFEQIEEALQIADDIIQPTVIIADTIKGKGVAPWHNNNLFHYAKIDENDYQIALKYLNERN